MLVRYSRFVAITVLLQLYRYCALSMLAISKTIDDEYDDYDDDVAQYVVSWI